MWNDQEITKKPFHVEDAMKSQGSYQIYCIEENIICIVSKVSFMLYLLIEVIYFSDLLDSFWIHCCSSLGGSGQL